MRFVRTCRSFPMHDKRVRTHLITHICLPLGQLEYAMRQLATLTCLILVLAPAVASAQTQNRNAFPWRSNNTNKGIGSGTVISDASVPNAPVMKSRPIFSASVTRNQQDPQPSPSDKKVQDFSFDQKPVPDQPYYQNNSAQQPGLSVQSNALPESAANNNCNSCYNNCCNVGCPGRLFKKPLFNAFDIYGFGQVGYHDNSTTLFNQRPGKYGLHQFWMTIEEPTGRNSQFGMRIDAVYGLDAQRFQAVGNTPVGAPNDWDAGYDNGNFGWAIPQAYVSWASGNINYKAGKFLSPFGYEKVPSIENFFYSRTFTRTYTEPMSNTGIIAEVQRDANTTLMGGVTAGWDTGFEQAAGGFTLLTGVSKQVNQNVKLSITSSLGDTGYRNSGTLNSAIAELKLLPHLNYVIQGDALNLDTNQEFGLIQYLFYDCNECLALGARLEWWKGDQIFAGATSSTYDFTVGANYRPASNLLIRPEMRWDWGAAAVDPGATIIGIDAIMVF